MTMSRRRLIRAAAALAGGCVAGAFPIARSETESVMSNKRISLTNVHTAEHVNVEFFRAGAYVPEALSAIEIVLRDFRNGERHAIDPNLMATLFEVAQRAGVPPEFDVISGYRSPQTNDMLRERTAGVAKHSLHIEGRAIDVRLAGVYCADLAMHARRMARGGVGYYRLSNFVHLDTGAYRTWNG